MKQLKILLVACLLSNIAFGQSDSLNVYLETAAKNSPSVRQKWSEYQAALQKVPQASSLPDPDLNLGLFLQPMELPGGNQVADIQLMQMFPWFGVLKNAKDEMSLMAKASLTSVQDAKLQLWFEVRTAWYALRQNREQLRITQRNLELLQQLERLALARYRSGASVGSIASGGGSSMTAKAEPSTGGMSGMGGGASAPQTTAAAPMPSAGMPATSGGGVDEIYALQVQKQELTYRLANLEDAFGSQQLRFNLLLNRSASTPVVLSDAAWVQESQPDTSLSQNPMLLMLGFEQEALEARRKMAEKMGYPMVGVGLKYSVLSKNPASTSMMNGQDMLMPMVSVSLPIYRKKYKASQSEAEWLLTATRQRQEATRLQLQADLQRTLLDRRDALRRLEVYQRQRAWTETSYQLQLKRFAASSASLSDLLSLSRQLLDYEEKTLSAQVDLMQAQARLRLLTGQD